MKRYFISHAPRFGSYENPVHWKIEQSPYFFWWLALTYNPSHKPTFVDDAANQVWRDFGDVSFHGDKHLGFTKWWLGKVDGGERRGEYLFAEPLSGTSTGLVKNLDEARSALEDSTSILVRVTLGGQRKFIDATLDRIIRKHGVFERGRNVKNPTRSNARYSLSKPVQIDALQRVFKVYALKDENPDFANYDVYKRIGYKLERYEFEELNEYRRRISTLVSRDYGAAKRMVENAAKGQFP